MLTLTIPSIEQWDEANERFVWTKEYTLQLEHSLVSLSKWESKWQKPFLSKEERTSEESIDYIRCMTITQNVEPEAYKYITSENIKAVTDYLEAPMTATTFRDEKKGLNREIVTAEVIYYWMVTLNIPFECQKWHLNKLIALIKVCDLKSQPPKKMSKRENMSRQAALNAARRRSTNSKG